MQRGPSLGFGLLAALVLLAAAPVAFAELTPVATEPIHSHTYDVGATKAYEAHGNVSVPNGTVEVRLQLDWEANTADGSQEATVWLCSGTCNDHEGFAQITAHPPLDWSVQLPDIDHMGWQAEPTNVSTRGVNLTGTATFLAPTDAHHTEQATTPPSPNDEGSSPMDGQALATVAGGLAALGALVYALRRWLPGGLVGLFSRISKDELLDNANRKQIYEFVDASPGIHFNAIARRLDLSKGQLEHHLDKLLDAGMVTEHRSGQHRCFSLPGALASEVSQALPTVKAPGARRVLQAAIDGADTIQDVAERSDLATSTASYHVDRLEDEGLLDADRDGRKLRVQATDLGRRVEAAVDPS